jgi:uncharacterized protein (UPF0332 family)
MNLQDVELLVHHRLKQAEDTIQDAQLLLQCQGTLYGIINRIYYAMFYAVLALLQSAGKGSSKHAGVISLFDSEFVHKGAFHKELSASLHKIFDLRLTADYKVTEPVPRDAMQPLVDEAQVFVAAIKTYLQK